MIANSIILSYILPIKNDCKLSTKVYKTNTTPRKQTVSKKIIIMNKTSNLWSIGSFIKLDSSSPYVGQLAFAPAFTFSRPYKMAQEPRVQNSDCLKQSLIYKYQVLGRIRILTCPLVLFHSHCPCYEEKTPMSPLEPGDASRATRLLEILSLSFSVCAHELAILSLLCLKWAKDIF